MNGGQAGSLTADVSSAGPLWTAEEVIRWIGMSAIGFVLYAVAWYLAADQAASNAQMGWVNLGVVGLVLFGVANTMWLMRGHRAVRARTRASVSDAHPVAVSPSRKTAPAFSALGADLDGQLVAGEGAHYHRAECPMAQGRAVTAMGRSAHEAGGRRPCGICRP